MYEVFMPTELQVRKPKSKLLMKKAKLKNLCDGEPFETDESMKDVSLKDVMSDLQDSQGFISEDASSEQSQLSIKKKKALKSITKKNKALEKISQTVTPLDHYKKFIVNKYAKTKSQKAVKSQQTERDYLVLNSVQIQD